MYGTGAPAGRRIYEDANGDDYGAAAARNFTSASFVRAWVSSLSSLSCAHAFPASREGVRQNIAYIVGTTLYRAVTFALCLSLSLVLLHLYIYTHSHMHRVWNF